MFALFFSHQSVVILNLKSSIDTESFLLELVVFLLVCVV